MMKPVGDDDPTYFAQCIERRAHIVRGGAGAMNPEGTAGESNDGRSCSQTDTAKPYRPFGDPDGVRHDDVENARNGHERSLPSGPSDLPKICWAGRARRVSADRAARIVSE